MGLVRSLCAISVLAACGSAAKREPPAPPANDAVEPAPIAPNPLSLVAGESWIFQGTWTRYDEASARDIETPLTWTMTVVEITEQGGEQRARITGWPADAPDDPAGETAVTFGEAMIRLGDQDWLRLPIEDGDQVCLEESTYCWSVEASGTGHDVILRTSPDVTIYHLEPGRGLTRFEYHHNGTTDDLVLERVE
jgi:hypothetical protein